MQNNEKIKGIALLTLANKDDAKKPLIEGNNLLKVNNTIGTKVLNNINALIKDINKSNKELIANTISKLSYNLPNVKDGDSVGSLCIFYW